MTLEDVVASEMCIGCGLCRSRLGSEVVSATVAENGVTVPALNRALTDAEQEAFRSYCPGAAITAPGPLGGVPFDPIWGNIFALKVGYATDPEFRFNGTSGGVLSAICSYALDRKLVDFILHIAPDPDDPIGARIVHSRTRQDLLAAMGSRYVPTTPLETFRQVLESGARFGFIGKPCDVMAVRNLARIDSAVDANCAFTLSFACGGSSELPKTLDVLAKWGIAREDLTRFTWRGPGCPGPVRAETTDGRAFEMPLEEFYEGPESNWRYVFRCKMCPDGIGLSADITGADCWEDCMPDGEDPGFNTIVARTAAGSDLLRAVIDADYITITEDIGPDRMSATQPHHVRKRIAMKARMAGLEDVIGTRPDLGAGLRLDELSDDPESETFRSNREGTAERQRHVLSVSGRG